jgi:hypothetical protein
MAVGLRSWKQAPRQHHGGVAGKGTPAITAARRAAIAFKVHDLALSGPAGLELELSPGDLVAVTGATVAPLSP